MYKKEIGFKFFDVTDEKKKVTWQRGDCTQMKGQP